MSEKCQIMWEKLFLFTVITWMISPIQSAVIECNWDAAAVCTPYNITPITQQNEVITINGQPSSYVHSETYYATFSNQAIKYIPSGLLTLFPQLYSYRMDKCGTTTLTTDSFPGCLNLNWFEVYGGIITHIPAGVLQSCKILTRFILTETSLATIDGDAFRGLTKLEILDLTNNKISSIPPTIFQQTPSLSRISLWNNLITSIDSNLVANLPYLNAVYFGFNLLSYVPLMNLTGFANSWLHINFDSNPIYGITPDFCSIFGIAETILIGMYNISCIPLSSYIYATSETISASNCQNFTSEMQKCNSNLTSSTTILPTTVPPTTAVVTTPSPTPGSCPSDKICRYFLDQYNRYTCILDGVDSVLTSISGNHLITFSDPNVRRVIFTNSFLSRIPPILFQKFPSLEYLTVSNCSMSAINTNTFSACGTLKYFDASSNFITTVDGASFKSCAALEVIDLTGNNFDMISGQLFVNNPMLKAVYINRPPAMVLV